MDRRTVIGGIAASGLAACSRQSLGYLPTYRFRMMVFVDTPEGRRSGWSVIEVRMRDLGRTLRPEWSGEAACVDLGARGRMFALMSSPSRYNWASSIFFILTQPSPEQRMIDARRRYREGEPDTTIAQKYNEMLTNIDPIVVPRRLPRIPGDEVGESGYPTLVVFPRPTDALSMTVTPAEDLHTVCGEGVRLRGIVLQLTSDPVSTHNRALLPPMGPESGWPQKMQRLATEPGISINPLQFARE